METLVKDCSNNKNHQHIGQIKHGNFGVPSGTKLKLINCHLPS